MKKNKNSIVIFILFIIALLPRIWSLGGIPISLSDDEVRQGYSAYSFFKYNKGIYGEFFPLGFKIDGFVFGPVSIYISSLFFYLFNLDAFSVRLPYALCGVFSVLLMYKILKKELNNLTIAIIASFLMSFSVWSIHVSRLAHDVNFALVFYLLGVYLFLISKKNKFYFIIFSAIAFVLGFFSYAATKVIYIPLLLIISWYKFKDLSKKQLVTFWTLIILSFLLFIFLAKTQGLAQYVGGQFFFQDLNSASLNVELQRRASLESELAKNIFHNKATYWLGTFLNNYLRAFSTDYLFLNQEASGIYSVWGRGMLYAIELPLLIIGICWLMLKKRRLLIFIALILLISPLPSGVGVSTPTYLTRSVFMMPWLYFLIAVGIYSISKIILNKHIKIIIYLIIFIIYTYSISSYFSQYYNNWSYYGAKYYSKSTKDLVKFINKEKEKASKIIIYGASENTFLHYALYNRTDPKMVYDLLDKHDGKIIYSNLEFNASCEKKEIKSLNSVENNIYIVATSCKKEDKPDFVIKLHDGTEDIWNIYLKK